MPIEKKTRKLPAISSSQFPPPPPLPTPSCSHCPTHLPPLTPPSFSPWPPPQHHPPLSVLSPACFPHLTSVIPSCHPTLRISMPDSSLVPSRPSTCHPVHPGPLSLYSFVLAPTPPPTPSSPLDSDSNTPAYPQAGNSQVSSWKDGFPTKGLIW